MKVFKLSSLLILMVVSFYLTDKIMIYLENQNPLMQEIKEKSTFYQTDYVNATINDDTIVPGINGKKVDSRKSYLKMGEFGTFNETFLVYTQIKPEISLEDHPEKIIINGNPAKRQISLIIMANNKVSSYLKEQDIPYTVIANLKSDLKEHSAYLNGEKTKNNAADLNVLLNKNKVNANLCLVGYSNPEFCGEKKYSLVAPTLDTTFNITGLLTKIKSGDIILINQNTALESLKLILKEINRQDLKIVYLSDLVNETI